MRAARKGTRRRRQSSLRARSPLTGGLAHTTPTYFGTSAGSAEASPPGPGFLLGPAAPPPGAEAAAAAAGKRGGRGAESTCRQGLSCARRRVVGAAGRTLALLCGGLLNAGCPGAALLFLLLARARCRGRRRSAAEQKRAGSASRVPSPARVGRAAWGMPCLSPRHARGN